jgi:hypothetical protein
VVHKFRLQTNDFVVEIVEIEKGFISVGNSSVCKILSLMHGCDYMYYIIHTHVIYVASL